jgi:hypothetical protein
MLDGARNGGIVVILKVLRERSGVWFRPGAMTSTNKKVFSILQNDRHATASNETHLVPLHPLDDIQIAGIL